MVHPPSFGEQQDSSFDTASIANMGLTRGGGYRDPRHRCFSAHCQLPSATAYCLCLLDQGPNLCRYSPETMNAFTISALMKLLLNWLSFPSQKL